jgi:hypothetical protein
MYCKSALAKGTKPRAMEIQMPIFLEQDPIEQIDPSWPQEVGLILSALEAAGPLEDRRNLNRMPYRVRAGLRLFSDVAGSETKWLFTRDVNHRSLGFISADRLPLGYGGKVELPTPAGQIVTVTCTLLRCREVAPGWFEGALYFNRDRKEFTPPDFLDEPDDYESDWQDE